MTVYFGFPHRAPQCRVPLWGESDESKVRFPGTPVAVEAEVFYNSDSDAGDEEEVPEDRVARGEKALSLEVLTNKKAMGAVGVNNAMFLHYALGFDQLMEQNRDKAAMKAAVVVRTSKDAMGTGGHVSNYGPVGSGTQDLCECSGDWPNAYLSKVFFCSPKEYMYSMAMYRAFD
ncbi:hypothetical protein BX600DRAFT_439436 [Xylariales sp. PMI_506]|nr:hypothetical protein BX600DRAFT_439436 [Xylariales sp. PMI_506]